MKIDREWAIHESDIGCDGRYLSDTEIVRCKDCVDSEVIPKEMQNVGEWFCNYWCAEMHEDDYCSCGKRRDTSTKEEQL